MGRPKGTSCSPPPRQRLSVCRTAVTIGRRAPAATPSCRPSERAHFRSCSGPRSCSRHGFGVISGVGPAATVERPNARDLKACNRSASSSRTDLPFIGLYLVWCGPAGRCGNCQPVQQSRRSDTSTFTLDPVVLCPSSFCVVSWILCIIHQVEPAERNGHHRRDFLGAHRSKPSMCMSRRCGQYRRQRILELHTPARRRSGASLHKNPPRKWTKLPATQVGHVYRGRSGVSPPPREVGAHSW